MCCIVWVWNRGGDSAITPDQVREMKNPLNKRYHDTNTALFTSFTLSIHMLAISHWLSHIIDVAGECKRDAWVIN